MLTNYQRVPVADGVALNVAVGGQGDPVVLLHGFPQTHLMWRHVAADLVQDHTVIAPDLRGYGESDKPATGYAKRTMAQDVVNLARALGHDRFTLVGHDRGALVAFRAGLDHPNAVAGLMCLDVLPTVDMWDVLHGVHASVAWHLYLMAQPPGLPERMIEADPDVFFGHFLDAWSTSEVPADVRREYLAACRKSTASIVADYRASAFDDIDHDTVDKQQGNQLRMPVTVIQHDWGFDGRERWRAWAPDLEHHTVTYGHFMAEEAPVEITEAIRKLNDRSKPGV